MDDRFSDASGENVRLFTSPGCPDYLNWEQSNIFPGAWNSYKSIFNFDFVHENDTVRGFF